MSTEETILRHLQDGNLIAFIGAGVSRSVSNPSGGVLCEGLPDAYGIVEAMSRRVKDISPDMKLDDAAFLFRRTVGDREYKKFLEETLNPPDLVPLPAHRCLALLPFTSYVSMNFDVLLERALEEANQDFHIVIGEQDFYAPNLFRRRIVLKPHGCITQLDSVVLSSDELTPYSERAPLVDSLLRVLLANTPVLFIGFGLQDSDFRTLIQSLRKTVKALPRSFAVAQGPTRLQREYWAENNIDLVDADLTSFLTMLAAKLTGEDFPIHLRNVDFLDDSMFKQIASSRVQALPTETQVIEAFLDSLATRLLQRESAQALIADARNMADKVKLARPLYAAFRRVAEQTLEAMDSACTGSGGRTEDVFEVLRQIRSRRSSITDRIRTNGRSIIRRNDKILLYSQSVRVAELLASVAPFIQENCELFISECRPKSPRLFFDAAYFAEALLETRYQIRFIPDVAATTLIATERVTKVLLGAHTIYFDDSDHFTGFINTCGSLQIALACAKFDVPIFVVAEREKSEREADRTTGYFEAQEERLEVPMNIGLPPLVFRQLSKVPVMNIGYDYVPTQPNITLITDDPADT